MRHEFGDGFLPQYNARYLEVLPVGMNILDDIVVALVHVEGIC